MPDTFSAPADDGCQDAFGNMPVFEDRGTIRKAILAMGKQDIEVAGMTPRIDVEVLGATSDHLVLDAKDADVRVGSEVAFDVNYSALLRAMASPYVTKQYRGASPVPSEISVPVSVPEALAQIREAQIDSCP